MSGTETATEEKAASRSPRLTGTSARPRAAAGEQRGDRVAVAGVQRVGDRAQVVGEAADQRRDPGGVQGQDLAPERGVARRDPGGVLQPRAGQRGRRRVAPQQLSGQRARRHLRQVADQGDGGVVALRGELHRDAPTQADSAATSASACAPVSGAGHSTQGRPANSDGQAGRRPAALAAGHRVAAADGAEVAAGARPARPAPAPGRDDTCVQVRGDAEVLQPAHDGRDRGGRRADDGGAHRLGAVPGPAGARGRTADRQRRRVGVGQQHVGPPVQREPERGADQAGADDQDVAPHPAHWGRSVRSAAAPRR